MTDCFFCKIGSGEIKPDIVFQDEHVIAFRDISPQAPVHVLIIPRAHVATLNDLGTDQAGLADMMFTAVQKIAAQEGIADSGYRTVVNCNADGGQSVYHLHMHLLGGRQLEWPPG